mmetsp:Transcript_3875/g.16071  ORF Transcript_3875/g.16071 Transcript_3875/m.16071 type:complete len:411 (+) Transcript_3875:83-1315(+)
MSPRLRRRRRCGGGGGGGGLRGSRGRGRGRAARARLRLGVRVSVRVRVRRSVGPWSCARLRGRHGAQARRCGRSTGRSHGEWAARGGARRFCAERQLASERMDGDAAPCRGASRCSGRRCCRRRRRRRRCGCCCRRNGCRPRRRASEGGGGGEGRRRGGGEHRCARCAGRGGARSEQQLAEPDVVHGGGRHRFLGLPERREGDCPAGRSCRESHDASCGEVRVEVRRGPVHGEQAGAGARKDEGRHVAGQGAVANAGGAGRGAARRGGRPCSIGRCAVVGGRGVRRRIDPPLRGPGQSSAEAVEAAAGACPGQLQSEGAGPVRAGLVRPGEGERPLRALEHGGGRCRLASVAARGRCGRGLGHRWRPRRGQSFVQSAEASPEAEEGGKRAGLLSLDAGVAVKAGADGERG